MRPLRIALALSGTPLPFGQANGRGFYVLLKGLVERGHRVTVFAPCRTPEEATAAREWFPPGTYDLRLYPYPARAGLRAKWETLRRPHSYPFAPNLLRELTEVERECDVVHLEVTWTGWLGRSLDRSKAVLSVLSLYEIDNPRELPMTLPQRFQRTLQRRAEREVIRGYPTLLTLTPRLAQRLQQISPRSVVHVVPLGLDAKLYPFVSKDRRPSKPLVSVIGSMDWYPSYSAAVRLLTRLWPQIKKAHPSAQLRIVGWKARSALRRFPAATDVEILEDVKDIRPHFEETSVLLYAPAVGSGMKVKILEAFAYGSPVVTTPDGVEGLPAVDGIHAGVATADEALIARTVALLGDRERQERQRQAARALVETYCSPSKVLPIVEQCYEDLLRRREQTQR
jgi:glycosyltransferase involved in cell wall biosynthesis